MHKKVFWKKNLALFHRQYDDEAEVQRVRSAKNSVTTRAQAASVLGPEVQGYRRTDVENLRRAMEEMHTCKGGKINVKELTTSGFCSTLLFECSICSHKVHMDTAKQTAGKVKSFDVNRRSVYASGELGLGRKGLATLCKIMNLPCPIYENSYKDHVRSIHATTKTVLEGKLRELAQKLRKYKMEQDVNIETDAIIDVPVSFDGTCNKRGFTANFGIGFVISSETGEVLDYCVLSKVCDYCKQSEKLKKTLPRNMRNGDKLMKKVANAKRISVVLVLQWKQLQQT